MTQPLGEPEIKHADGYVKIVVTKYYQPERINYSFAPGNIDHQDERTVDQLNALTGKQMAEEDAANYKNGDFDISEALIWDDNGYEVTFEHVDAKPEEKSDE
jgi:hypothetical protein